MNALASMGALERLEYPDDFSREEVDEARAFLREARATSEIDPFG